MIYLSDLHLFPESEDVCFRVLDAAKSAEEQTGHAVAFTGDFWHVRYAIPIYLLNRVREALKGFRRFFFLPGNHDQIDVGGRHAMEVFSDLPNVTVFTEPAWHRETGCWLPYRKDPKVLLDWLAANPRPDGFPEIGHLHHGIVGAAMNNGIAAGPLDGLMPSQLAQFRRVYCGHWHRHQQIEQCVYIGSPWQVSSAEAGQSKGFVLSSVSPGVLTGEKYVHHPLDLGARHHKLQSFLPQEIAAIRPGDVVKVPAGTSPKMVDALVALGAEVRSEAAAPAVTGPRLGVDSSAPLRAQALKYIATQQLPENMTPEILMAFYDEVSGG